MYSSFVGLLFVVLNVLRGWNREKKSSCLPDTRVHYLPQQLVMWPLYTLLVPQQLRLLAMCFLTVQNTVGAEISLFVCSALGVICSAPSEA